MAPQDFNKAMANRSIRNIKTELDFLVDASIISSQQRSSIISQLPSDGSAVSAASTPAIGNLNLNGDGIQNTASEKRQNGYFQQPAAAQPPPAYPVAPAPPSDAITYATALYAYSPTDAGDLGFVPNERIAVTEYMNAEWWKGRSERTGKEGIFPRSYVRADDTLSPGARNGNALAKTSSYGNMPLDVSQSGGGGGGGGGEGGSGEPSRAQQEGKKFGKKLGNAAIFGAGATIGGKIVNGIF